MAIKPILFNTPMVQAILEGRKTVTRRIVKLPNHIKQQNNGLYTLYADGDCYEDQHFEQIKGYIRPPYQSGDILYVREKWRLSKELKIYAYAADYDEIINGLYKWKPSIHMPREAARIWLRVTDVRVERLQDIMKDPPGPNNQIVREGCKYGCDFIAVWDRTVKKSEKNITVGQQTLMSL